MKMNGWMGLLCAVASGVMWALSRDIGPVGPLILLAPVPILIYALTSPDWRKVAALAFVARVIGGAGLVLAYAKVLPVIWAMVVGQGLVFALIALLVMRLDRRMPPWLTALGFAATIAALDYLTGLVSPNGSFGALGYSLVDVLQLLQVASVGGVVALSFLAAIVPAALALAMTRGFRWPVVAVAAVPVAAALVWGTVALLAPSGPAVRVAVIADDRQPRREDPAANRAIAEAYAAQAEAQKAAYIVLPEKMLIHRDGGVDGADGLLQAAADKTGAVVVAGFDETVAGVQLNSAHIYTRGQPVQSYAKRHMVPGLETEFKPGDRDYVRGAIGVAICKDMDFPATIRGYAGVKLMLVPAWDFGLDGRLHARMATVRAVENGFALARAASEGRVTVNDAQGRIIAEAVTERDRPVAVTADVPLGSGTTIYGRFGDVFGWVMAGLFGVFVVPGVFGKARATETPNLIPPQTA